MEDQNCIRFQGKLMILFLLILILSAATSTLQKDVKEFIGSDGIGCLPCSQKFLVSSYFEKHTTLVDSDFEGSLAEESLLSGSCKWLEHDMSHMPRLSISHRYLSGEGSHRHLVSSIRFDIDSDLSRLDTGFCEAVLIERLPAGVFADPFELQHLVQHGAFFDAAVFGDTNLELPSALSSRSVVEVHKDIGHDVSLKDLRGLEFTFELILHSRYPPLDSKGYSRVVMGQPELMLRCTPKTNQEEDCSSLLIKGDGGYATEIVWQMPCGNEEHTRIVSAVTFVSALTSALLIVCFAMYPSVKKDSKNA